MIGYQFAILRYLHDAFAGELVNVGVAMWSPAKHLFAYRLSDRYSRLSSFYPGFDGAGYRKLIQQLKTRFEAAADTIGTAGQSVLFRTPPDSLEEVLPHLLQEDAGCFQWSEIMGGITTDPVSRLEQLAEELIERHQERSPRQRKGDDEIWVTIEQRLAASGLLDRVERGVIIQSPNYEYRFRSGWQNGTRQVIEPISFDYLYADSILDTATKWGGRLQSLSKGGAFQMTGVVSPPSLDSLMPAYEKALGILRDSPQIRRVLAEEDFDSFLPEIESDLSGHHPAQ